MSQARVTDFFSQRKKGIAGPIKPARQRSRGSAATTRSRSSKNKEALLCSSAVHEEFVRVIDEAAGLNDGESNNSTTKDFPSSPQTPKRTSAEAEFDLGAAVFSATTDHSTAKKRRQAEAATDAQVLRRTARKKLDLPQDPPQVGAVATECVFGLLVHLK